MVFLLFLYFKIGNKGGEHIPETTTSRQKPRLPGFHASRTCPGDGGYKGVIEVEVVAHFEGMGEHQTEQDERSAECTHKISLRNARCRVD